MTFSKDFSNLYQSFQLYFKCDFSWL